MVVAALQRSRGAPREEDRTNNARTSPAGWPATDIGLLELRHARLETAALGGGAAGSTAAPNPTLRAALRSVRIPAGARIPLHAAALVAASASAVPAGQAVGVLQIGPLLLPVTRASGRQRRRRARGRWPRPSATARRWSTSPRPRRTRQDRTMDIDLNADLGEGFGPWRMGEDEALLDIVSSANVACGFHAGDPLIMDRTVRMALAARRRRRRARGLSRPGGLRPPPMQMDTARTGWHTCSTSSARWRAWPAPPATA